ncbi:MAG TPA: hypothetical protein VHQ90_20390 [Thermoanaerobaculia bacterium]|nr:hypothetical protein [Thermoanaerobaculia bacterium]
MAAIGYLVLASFYLQPIWRVFGTHIAPDPFDPVFNLYLLKWGAHQLPHGFQGFWDPPFFYPSRHVLTYSDHLLGPGLALAAIGGLGASPLAVYNGILLASFVLCGLTTFYVLGRGGASTAAAFLGGCMYAFSPFRWEQLPHLQILLMQWIPVTLWSFDRLLARVTWRRAGVFLLFYLLHISGSNYLAYMIHVPLIVLLLNRLSRLVARLRGPTGWRAANVLASMGLLAGTAVALIYAPYWQASRGEGLAWDPSVLQEWGASILSYLTPSHWNLYFGIWPQELWRPENSLFPGWLTGALAAVALVALLRRRRQPLLSPSAPSQDSPGARWHRWVLAGLLAAAVAGWMGGELHTWARRHPGLERLVPGHGYRLPLLLLVAGLAGWSALRRYWDGEWPLLSAVSRMRMKPWRRGLLLATLASAALSTALGFGAASRLLPGMTAMRVPARFGAFVSFGLVVAAAGGLDLLRARLRSELWRASTMALAVLVAVAELAPRRIEWQPLAGEAQFPPVYAWLARQPDVHALLEIPIRPELHAATYLYYGTLHWKPLVNGYSAHFPLRYILFADRCCWPVPDRESLAELRRWGVTHLVVHLDRLPEWQLATLRRWELEGAVPRVYADPATRVYRIFLRPPARSREPGTTSWLTLARQAGHD